MGSYVNYYRHMNHSGSVPILLDIDGVKRDITKSIHNYDFSYPFCTPVAQDQPQWGWVVRELCYCAIWLTTPEQKSTGLRAQSKPRTDNH